MAGNIVFAARSIIEAAQERNFAEMMDLVFEGHPYYRALLTSRGLARADFRSLADLVKLPVTIKEDYMTTPDDFRLRIETLPEEMRPVWDVMYTTGSTSGRRTPFVSTTFDFYNILALGRSMMEIRGVRNDDILANLFPLTQYPHCAFARALHAPSMTNIPVVSAMPGNPSPSFAHGNGLDEVVDIVARTHATILLGVPSYVRQVLLRAEELGADLSAVRMVFVTGEGLPEAARADLVARLGRLGAGEPMISDAYGSTEVQGGMVECRPGAGFHNPAPDQLYVEIVDPETHEPLPDGDEGLIVLTHLKRRGTVLLRYAMGDASVLTHERCPACGANTDRLVATLKRVDALVKIKGMLVNPAVITEELQGMRDISEFQLVVGKVDPADPLSMDRLTLRVASAGGSDEALAARLGDLVKRAIGITPVVEFVRAADLLDPSQDWKTKRLVDLRPKPE